MDNGFPFTVTISAAEWSELQRRLRFVEAALVQTLRGQRRLKEWFSAVELTALELPGLPMSRQGLLRRAQAERWQQRTMYGAGGVRYEFHFSSLPRLAFEALLERIVVALPDAPAELEPPSRPFRPRAIAVPLPIQAVNATPPWLLPLLRVIKSDGTTDVGQMMEKLGERLPAGVMPPTVEEVHAALLQFGYAS